MNEERIYEIIAAYLAGETDNDQNERLQEWIGLSENNRRIFNDLHTMWIYGAVDRKQMEDSKEVVLKRVIARVRRRRALKPVAAVVTLTITAYLGFAAATLFTRPGRTAKAEISQVVAEPEGNITISTLPGQKAEASLSDGSKVWLNSGTTISYPASYGIEERTATLVEGEIFMEVAKNENVPFVLNTSKGIIKVHGTSFNVRDYTSDSSMTISLKEGSIEYIASDNKSNLMMLPGQKVVLDKDPQQTISHDNSEITTAAMALQKCDADLESLWRFGELKIERKSFMDLMAEMERWYGVEIDVSGNIPKESYYWMTIKTESLREMLALLTKITPLTYKIDGQSVLIRIK